ncbi:DUF664 domain-containing protein [Euzebya tangerina]|uniref:mycothiol transferase n=1 Tax=Euzebya tangerina TaxID=591198 RepID=UPI000E31D4C2|nr:DUF664 domain-containing protein [Euzebya tangerina]
MSGLPPPWQPPMSGSEVDHLVAMLERLRATFRWKADGLDTDALRQPIESSTLTLGGLLKHLAAVEDDVFERRIAGQPSTTRGLASNLASNVEEYDEWQFTLGDHDDADGLYAMWDSAVARSRERLSQIIDTGSLDAPGAVSYDGETPSIRRHVCDLIEEYGRHTGHADLLREAVDGRVGEDPPPEWRPTTPE